MNVQLTAAQRLQQELINGFITDLEKQIQQGATGVAVNADLGNTLNGLFATFDKNKDAKFNANELTGLTGHLRQINTDQNIAQLFKTDGQLNFATTNKADITGDGKFLGTEDLVALQQIIGSRTSLLQTVPQTSTLTNNGQIKSGTGNVPGGLNNFNSGGAYFVTESGFTVLTDVNVGGYTTMIYDNTGKMISRIWGDPHVEDDSGVGGDDWHFGNDSTFILPDGTEIMFNTEGNFSNNVFITTGLYIKSGNDVYQTGQSFGTSTTGVASSSGAMNSSISKLGISATEFDAQYADAANDKNGAGVFAYSAQANSGRGGWAIMTEGGNFRDVKYESWGVYLQAGNASFKGQYDGQVIVSKAQMIAALDGEAVRSFKSLSNSSADSQMVLLSLGLSIAADDLFLNYYFEEGANTEELKAYSNMILNGSSAEKLSVLDNYIRNGAETSLSPDQESKFLNYLVTPATSGIAETYLALIKNDASPEKFELLDNLAKGEYSLDETQSSKFLTYLSTETNTDIAKTYAGVASTYLTLVQNNASPEKLDLLDKLAKREYSLDETQGNKFLDYLTNETNTDIAKTYLSLVTGNDANKTAKLAALEVLATNNATDKLDDTQEDTFLNYLTTEENINIAQTYANILNGNEADNIKTDSIQYLEDYAAGKLGITLTPTQENQMLTYLGGSTNSNIAKSYVNNVNFIQATVGLDSTQKELYRTFANAFPVGQTPTEAQSKAAVGLITTGGYFGNNSAFLTNYAKFVSSGDTTSANNLIEIANYFRSKPDYASKINNFSNINLDEKSISAAIEIIDFTKRLDDQNSTDLTRLILTTRNLAIDTVLGGVDNIFDSATEGDLTRGFFESLKKIFSEKPDSIDNEAYNKAYSRFARNAISKFSKDHLELNGVLYPSSFTTVLAEDINNGKLGIYVNNEVARMQIGVFEGMIEFYDSMIEQEDKKPDKNTSKIEQWESQITSHQAAKAALGRTLS